MHLDNGECIIIDKKKKFTMAKVKMTPNKNFPLMMALNENFALKGRKS